MKQFKLARDPQFVAKLRDVVGLYLDPPERAVVFSFDEKSQIQEFLAFLNRMVRTVTKGLAIHVILDNYATHQHAAVQRWLARHKRVQFHFIPTSASWLNLVERFFSELMERQIRRLAVTSVAQLITAITEYIDHRNAHPTPFVWTATVQQILQKVRKAHLTLATLH